MVSKKQIFLFIITYFTFVLTFQAQSQGNIKVVINNNDFLLLNNNTPSTISTQSSTFMCSTELTVNINWKVIEIGTVGSVKISAEASDLDLFLNTPNTLKFLKVADNDTFTTNVDYVPVKTDTINGVPQYSAFYNFDGTKYFTYSELNAITWSGNAASWKGGSGINNSPDTQNDADKLMIIDSESSQTHAYINNSTQVKCTWIKSNSNLILNNNLTIKNQLQLDGELRIVGDAQLLQTHLGSTQVIGLGKIYIDQIGTTTTTYRFNYWSSPVVEVGKNTYTVGGVMKDGTMPTSASSTPLDIQFTTAYNGSKTSPITIADYWIFTYKNGDSGFDWSQKKHNLSITPPLGFTMKGPGNGIQNYTFMGTPNDGDYNSIISPGKLSLLGNPYPSSIDAEKFIDDNLSSIEGTLYFWEMEGDSGTHYAQGYVGGYGIKNLAIGLAANTDVTGTAGLGDANYKIPGRYIPVGQGFFVSSSTGGTITFNNSQRFIQPIDGSNSIFFKANNKEQAIINQQQKTKSKKTLTQLKLGFEYLNPDGKEIHRQIGLTFHRNNSFSFDNGYDSYMFDPQPTDMYFKFKNDSIKYVAAGVGSFDKSLEIPVEIAISISGNFNFMIDDIDDKKNNRKVYLKDALTKKFYNLTDGITTLYLDSKIYKNRFFITFKKNHNSNENNFISNNLLVYFDKVNSEIVITKNDLIIQKVTLINLIRSKKYFKWNKIKDVEKIILQVKNITDGIYLAKINTNKGLITKKLFIYN